MKPIVLAICLLFSSAFLKAQQTYWVFFKGPSLSKAEQVNSDYLNKISSKNCKLIGTSKWFNAACISVNNTKELKKIEKLLCVNHIEPSRRYKVQKFEAQLNDTFNYGLADRQLKMLGLHTYHQKGNTGKGIRIALFDAGFYKTDSIIAFDSLRARKGILATRDFYANNPNVYDDDAHGMFVLSLISGYIKDSLVGSAPHATFLLARTEDVATERHVEEFNWIRALEWADSIGVDIIHSSLGYSLFDTLEGNYSYKDMDGKSTIITRAAEMAFSRGIFITNSAGNEGQKPWKYITAPCDGKNVLCIGALDSFGKHAKFSSFGPSADKRIKPDVMAMGHKVAIIGTNNVMRRGSGTSFSGPIMAGFVACLKQKFPTVNNTIILNAIRQSAHLYKTPNDSMGFGIPNINKADSLINLKLTYTALEPKKSSVFPNPFIKTLNLEGAIIFENLEIADGLGKIYRFKGTNNAFDLGELKSGIYYLKLENFRVIKLVKL